MEGHEGRKGQYGARQMARSNANKCQLELASCVL
jgi:hypothetical protein